MGRWSNKVAPIFLQWLDAPAQKSWIDIGCGTGWLSEKISTLYDAAQIIGVDSAAGFIETARERVENADFRVGANERLLSRTPAFRD